MQQCPALLEYTIQGSDPRSFEVFDLHEHWARSQVCRTENLLLCLKKKRGFKFSHLPFFLETKSEVEDKYSS